MFQQALLHPHMNPNDLQALTTADAHGGAASVATHSRAHANAAVFPAFVKPGDTFMGMSLAEGGHLSHGVPLKRSGNGFKPVGHGLDANEKIDNDAMERTACC